MRTVDRISINASMARVFAVAREVERWPAILPHYRWVRVLEAERNGRDGARVEMAAWRPFGPPPLRWPTWWMSEMVVDAPRGEIRYRHVRGITRGMDVVWRMRATEAPGHGGRVEVEVVHTWDGPPWPLIGRLAAALVIGPIFVHGIASRTLAGIKRHLEAESRG